jgi:hypothetical protein
VESVSCLGFVLTGQRASGPVFMFCATGIVFAVPRAFVPVFMFCAPILVFGGTEGVASRFHVLRPYSFSADPPVWSRFDVLRYRTRFGRYRGLLVPFSCFALPGSFPALPMASGPVFMFCAPGIVFGGTEGVGYRFHVLRAWISFRPYLGRWVPFSCFALPDSFLALSRVTRLDFLFCAP